MKDQVLYYKKRIKAMKKILVIITTKFVPYGGLTTVAMNYYRHIDHSNFKMDFASTNKAPEILENELKKNGDSYYRLPPRKKIVRYCTELKKLCAGYDAVHIHANSATATFELLAAKNAGVRKRIIHIHNTTCTHMTVHRILKPAFDRLYTDAVACSKAAGEWMFPENKYIVLNNAIDLGRYAYSEDNRVKIRNELGIGDVFVVGHVGKITAQKNHQFLIRCFAGVHYHLPDSKLLLVGDGDLKTETEEQVKRLKLTDNVIFTGMVNASESYLSAMDCFAFPSRWEGLPLSVVEAQANGLKCIVSDKVTEEVNVASELTFLPIEEECEAEWVKHILSSMDYDRKSSSKQMIRSLRDNHYDICDNAEALERIYTE